MTKFRIISDVHIEINNRFCPNLSKSKTNDVIDLVAGDICGYQDKAIDWLNKNIHGTGYFIEGNHIVYSKRGDTLHERQDILRSAFKDNSRIHYIENECHQVNDDTYIIGATLWTDFALFLNKPGMTWDIEDFMYIAGQQMNDYQWGRYYDIDKNEKVMLKPEHTLREFEKSYSFIKEHVEKHKNSKIVILTHHAPSAKSIPSKYMDSYISCAYASNLEEFIKSHDNIKLWVHGHCHEFKDYMISQCRVVCNPYGYKQYGEKTGFKKNFIVEI